MLSEFLSVPRILTGCGVVENVGEVVKQFGRRTLVVTGRRAARSTGLTDRLVDYLDRAGVETIPFEEAEPEPSLATVDRGRAAFREAGCDVVLGVGGGSTLDVAKAIAGLAHAEAETAEFHAGREIEGQTAPSVAVPTTSGTGSEVTKNSVLSDPAKCVKKSIRADSMLPRAVILDPELTVSLPPDVTAHSGMDALVQAVESYTSIHATPLTEGLSLHAVRLLWHAVPRAFEDGHDLEARTHAAYGSLMAGMALANARLGVVHGIAHPLGCRYHIPHGLLCGILLPAAVRLNRPFCVEKYRTLDRIAGGPFEQEAGDMLRALGMPTDLREFGIPAQDFNVVIEESMPSGSLKANPKKVSRADLREMLDRLAC